MLQFISESKETRIEPSCSTCSESRCYMNIRNLYLCTVNVDEECETNCDEDERRFVEDISQCF